MPVPKFISILSELIVKINIIIVACHFQRQSFCVIFSLHIVCLYNYNDNTYFNVLCLHRKCVYIFSLFLFLHLRSVLTVILIQNSWKCQKKMLIEHLTNKIQSRFQIYGELWFFFCNSYLDLVSSKLRIFIIILRVQTE